MQASRPPAERAAEGGTLGKNSLRKRTSVARVSPNWEVGYALAGIEKARTLRDQGKGEEKGRETAG